MNKTNKKVSIILPSRNSQAFISKCIESIKQQTYKNFECLIVDDSIDETKNVAKKTFNNDARFRIIDLEKGHRLGYARNVGIKHATGDYIFPVDSDDYIDNNCVEELVKKLEQTNCDVVSTNIITTIYKKGKYIRTTPQNFDFGIVLLNKNNIYGLINKYLLASPFKLFRRKIIENCQYIDEVPFAEDLLYIIDVACTNEFSYCISTKAIYHYSLDSDKVYVYTKRVLLYFEELNNRLINENDPAIKEQIATCLLNEMRYYVYEYFKKDLFYGLKVFKFRKSLLKSKKNLTNSDIVFLRAPFLYMIACRTKALTKKIIKIFCHK